MEALIESIGKTDIYLLDQILKRRYRKGDLILDAGCGSGRNMKWFINHNYSIQGLDIASKNIDRLRELHPEIKDQFKEGNLLDMPYGDDSFDHVICNAVLHFARDHHEFEKMLAELVRVTKSGGSIFVRLTSDIGVKDSITHLGKGKYALQDGTKRYLLTRSSLKSQMDTHGLRLLEPVKSTVVSDIRSMTTLVFGV